MGEQCHLRLPDARARRGAAWGLLARLVCLLAGRLLWVSIMGVGPILGFVGRCATDALGVTNT